jgi:hypothetical protein
MTVIKTFAQRDPRYPIPPAVDARVEFSYPNPGGRTLSTLLIDISVAGLSFVADHELPLVVRGARLEKVVVWVGDVEIRGSLLVKHFTRGAGSEVMYGGIFYPDSQADQLRLSQVIAELAVLD